MIYLLPQFHALVATRLSNLLVRSDLGVLDLPIVSGTPWWFLWLAWGTRRLYFCRLYPSMIGFFFLSIRVYVLPFSSFFPEAVSAQVWDPCKRIVSVVALKSMIFRLSSILLFQILSILLSDFHANASLALMSLWEAIIQKIFPNNKNASQNDNEILKIC